MSRTRRIMQVLSLLGVLGGLGVGMGGAAAAGGDQAAPGALPACLRAAQYAAAQRGALYSQGGAHPRDPIHPATGQPYPRTGPSSYDCSGLVFAAYRAAGVRVGATTATQVTQGVPIPCTLADLRGADTRCWAPGDLIVLRSSDGNGTGRHVALYVGNGLFADCYNHQVGCVVHAVERNAFYQRTFWQARRIVPGCETLTLDPGAPAPPLPGDPAGEAGCRAESPGYPETGVRYLRGCGPPVRPGDRIAQFRGVVGWLGPSGRAPPPGASAQLELRVGFGDTWVNTCRWPYQLAGLAPDEAPPGMGTCWSTWLDPQDLLPLAHADSLTRGGDGRAAPVGRGGMGDPTWADQPMQLPPPGHPDTLLLPPRGDQPGGAWWSPGNDERMRNGRCPLGGPRVTSWMEWLVAVLVGWMLGC
jgi:hypothetical protein